MVDRSDGNVPSEEVWVSDAVEQGAEVLRLMVWLAQCEGFGLMDCLIEGSSQLLVQ